MARSAADLALELGVLAGPDEMSDGIGYRLALPPPRHDALADFARCGSIRIRCVRPRASRLIWAGPAVSANRPRDFGRARYCPIWREQRVYVGIVGA